MEKDIVIVTNNSYIVNKTTDNNILKVEGDYIDVLYKLRDFVHLGHTLVTHPLPASIRMFYSPIRSVVIRKGFSEKSVEVIENSITTYKDTMGNRKPDYKNIQDYELMDMELIRDHIEKF